MMPRKQSRSPSRDSEREKDCVESHNMIWKKSCQNVNWKPIETTNIDLLLSFILFIFTLLTRFYRLAYPRQIVFDEFHFAEFVHQYLRGEYLFDIHPPFSKLVLSLVVYFAGYDVNKEFEFDDIGKPYGDLLYYPQREVSAFLGSMIPSVLYLTCRALDLSIAPSITAGAIAMFDMNLCIESRLIVTDAQLILYIQLSLLFALYLWRTRKNTISRRVYLILTAFFGGCGIATKWTAIVIPGMIGIISLTGSVFPCDGSLKILEMVIAGMIAVFVYMSSFWIHFRMLPYSGTGDNFMSHEFQARLKGNSWYRHASVKQLPGFLQNFWYLNWEMLRANNGIEDRHVWESKWYEWLYNARGIIYWDAERNDGMKEQIYLIVNPVGSLVTALGVLACIGLLIISPWLYLRVKRQMMTAIDSSKMKYKLHEIQKQIGVITFFLVSWILNLMPYIGIKRCTFLYHILPSFQIASIMTAYILQKIPAKDRVREFVCGLIIFCMFEAFVYWSPWVYALPRSQEEHQSLRWMPRWD